MLTGCVCVAQVATEVPFPLQRLIIEAWRHHAAGRPTMSRVHAVLEEVLAALPEDDAA